MVISGLCCKGVGYQMPIEIHVNDCLDPWCCSECPVMCVLADTQEMQFWIFFIGG